MKNCDLLALSLYLDSELLLPERRALEKHLRECAPCREELRRLRQSDRALVSWGARREPIPLETERQILRSIERNRRRRPLATFSRMMPAALGSCVAAVLVLMSANFVRLDQPTPTATSTESPTAIAAP